MSQRKHQLDPSFRLLMAEMKLDERAIMLRAGLPEDLLSHKEPRVSSSQFFSLFNATEYEAGQLLDFPIDIGIAAAKEVFSPSLFAFLCSPNLEVAIKRLSHYKSLCGPLTLPVTERTRSLTVTPGVPDNSLKLPESLALTELVFIVSLARRATKAEILPHKVVVSKSRLESGRYREFFGIEPTMANVPSITFDRSVLSIPFLSESKEMWATFEPQLQDRLSKLSGDEAVTKRVSAALLELLPGGVATMDSVAKKLAMSKRTLQRRLNEDGVSFQSVLNDTRKELAFHYLNDKQLSGAEISFLLGYQEASSFYRAFHNWTGSTPEAVRSSSKSA